LRCRLTCWATKRNGNAFSDRQLIQKFIGIFGGLNGVALVLANHHLIAVHGDDPFVVAGVRHGVAPSCSPVLCVVPPKAQEVSLVLISKFTKSEDDRRKSVAIGVGRRICVKAPCGRRWICKVARVLGSRLSGLKRVGFGQLSFVDGRSAKAPVAHEYRSPCHSRRVGLPAAASGERGQDVRACVPGRPLSRPP
jgi:hypothetical protein